MKKLRLLFSALALLLCSTSLLAQDFGFDGIYYKITSYAGLTVEVTYAGTNASDYDEYYGSVTIPETVMSYMSGYLLTFNVTSIGSSAFEGCDGLTSVTIPNSVTSIGSYAFSGCSGLTSIVIPNSVTSIGSYAFSDCSGLASIVIPDSVTSIGYSAFKGCSGLTSVTIPNSVTSIGDYAFQSCSGLTSVTIPNSVTSIGSSAFSGCSGLTSVTIPNSVTSIGGGAFYGTAWYDNLSDGVVYINDVLYEYKGTMPSGTSIEIKEGTVSISPYAFSSCFDLTSVTIPNSVTSIGSSAFSGCYFATENFVNQSELTDKSHWGAKLVDEEVDGLMIDDNTVVRCRPSVTIAVIPNSVTSIGNSAFQSRSGLTSVTIGNSVTSIGNYAFQSCSGLTSVTIGNSVTRIGDYAFNDCDGLTSIVIPNSVTSIGSSAFEGCSGLTSVTIGNSVTSIGWYAFSGCSGLTSVAIPNSVTSIGRYAFKGCSGLTSVTIPNSVTSIGFYAFEGCYFATENFVNQSELTDEKHWGANLVDEEVDGLMIDDNTVVGCRPSVTIAIIPNSVTNIGYAAFEGCSGLTSVTIPNSVTSIGECAFWGCSGLTSVTIPNSVTSIGSSAFYSCSGLTSVTIGNNVTSIGYDAFHGCSGLTSVTIPNSVTSIGDYAFSSCFGLTSVVIGNSVTNIRSYVFSDCPNLNSVTIGNSVNSIKENAFDGAELRTVVSLNPEPPAGSGISSTYTYNHATLYVPEDFYWAYAYTKGWGEFVHMKEIAISDKALVSSKAYMIADAKGCNYTVYDADKDELVNVEYTFALDEENEGACWTVMKEGGESYLYNIGAKKFAAMNEDGKLSLSDAPVNLDIATTESGLSINGNARMFVLNDKVDVDVTAINGITAEGINGADAPVYNLHGMKMQNADNLPKGIYIKDGKKYIIK